MRRSTGRRSRKYELYPNLVFGALDPSWFEPAPNRGDPFRNLVNQTVGSPRHAHRFGVRIPPLPVSASGLEFLRAQRSSAGQWPGFPINKYPRDHLCQALGPVNPPPGLLRLHGKLKQHRHRGLFRERPPLGHGAVVKRGKGGLIWHWWCGCGTSAQPGSLK